jgi:hypothetical protein
MIANIIFYAFLALFAIGFYAESEPKEAARSAKGSRAAAKSRLEFRPPLSPDATY